MKLSLNFIAGLIEGDGSFMWIWQNGKRWVPVFQLKMHVKDKKLVTTVRDSLGLNEPVYEYNHGKRHYVLLIIRKRKSLEENIFPAFRNRLYGTKRQQFARWADLLFACYSTEEWKKLRENPYSEKKKLSLDFIAGLITAEGYFGWTLQHWSQLVPIFALYMHYRDKKLITVVRNSLGLEEPMHETKYNGRHQIGFIVRKQSSFVDTIIPAFKDRLHGNKKKQFEKLVTFLF